MKQSYKNNAVSPSRSSSFLASLKGQSLTHAILVWLSFRASVNATDWQQRVQKHHLKADNPHALNQWLALQSAPLPPHSLLLPCALAIVIGVLSMLGVLSYSGAQPVNVWLMLALFCFAPLLMTLTSWVAVFRIRRSGQSLIETLLMRWLQRPAKGLLLFNFLNSLAVRAWLFLQAQILGLFLQLSLMATFLIVLLFNDIAFGWASTIIHSADNLHTVLYYLTLPWQWLLPAPSAELIQHSQYFYNAANSPANAEIMHSWWPHIFLAMVLYGLLPKITLVAFLQWRCRQLLRKEVSESAELEQFFNALNFTPSVQAKNTPDTQNTTYNITEQLTLKSTDVIVFWQRPSLMAAMPTLGVKAWRDDELWIKQHNKIGLNQQGETHHLWVIVQEHQTPTAELTDTLNLIKTLNAHLNIHLTVITAFANKINQPLTLALSTWRFFAAEQGLSLHGVSCVSCDGQIIVEAN